MHSPPTPPALPPATAPQLAARPQPPAGRKFPCPGCGAQLDFDPSSGALKCPYCAYLEKIDPASSAVTERDWNDYWQNAEGHATQIEGRSSEVRCGQCGAVSLLQDQVVMDACPYCGADLENKPEQAQAMILPEGILPFKISHDVATATFNTWVGKLWFAPGDLKSFAAIGRFSGAYIPFWTYDSMTFTHYTGERGDNYQETETYYDTETYYETDANGQQVPRTRQVAKTRIVTKIRWWPVSGNVSHFFDDVLICASKSMPPKLIDQLEPWDLKNLEPFQPAFLSGFQAERYTLGLKEGFDKARGIMDGAIRGLCCRDIGGDHQRLASVNTQHTAITFKHVLQPVWMAAYRYRGKTYRILVNARTGELVGTRPWSFGKVFAFVLGVIATIALIALIIAAAKGFQ